MHTGFEWNYTTFLNIVFLVLFGMLYWLYRNRDRLQGDSVYAFDPICGMQVRLADAPADAATRRRASRLLLGPLRGTVRRDRGLDRGSSIGSR